MNKIFHPHYLPKRRALLFLVFCMFLLPGCAQAALQDTTPSTTVAEIESISSDSAVSDSESSDSAISDTTTVAADTSLVSTSAVATSAKADVSVTTPKSPSLSANSTSSMIHLGFAGDFNLDENWATTQHLDQQPNGIYDCISPNLIALCNSFDVFMLNNEFTYSNRGVPLAGKTYVFRADPSRVETLSSLGTDLVLLANNHVYDYGEDAFLDTLSTLESANINYVGAGRDEQEACQPVYYTFGNTTLAYVAATRAEKTLYTPEATSLDSGVLRTYDPANYLSVIKNASENSDYVIASVHWGTEYSSNAEQYQRELAYSFIDAGADAVIGSHTHVLQGMEYYKGKPILYSLGNFWFNEKDLYSCVIDLGLNTETGTLESLRFIPCIQKNCATSWPTEASDCRKILDFEEGISFGVAIDDDGYVSPASFE